MSFRASVALLTVVVVGSAFALGYYLGVVGALVLYVLWMFLRDRVPYQGRVPIGTKARRRFMHLRDRPEWWS